MDIPTERPANADETQTGSEIAVLAAASVLVFVTSVLRYMGRWILQKRLKAGKGRSGDQIWGLDDCKSMISPGPRVTFPQYLTRDSVQHAGRSGLLCVCRGGFCRGCTGNGYPRYSHPVRTWHSGTDRLQPGESRSGIASSTPNMPFFLDSVC